MSLNETAQQVLLKAGEIKDKIGEIQDLAGDVLRKRVLNGEVIELSNGDKQIVIDAYLTAKSELASLVSQLP